MGISKQAYYQYKKRAVLIRQKELVLLSALIIIRKEHAEYGLRKVQYELGYTYGIGISLMKLSKVLHAYNLMSEAGLRKRHYNRSRSTANYPNLFNGSKVQHVNQVWICDMTYIRRGHTDRFYYLSMIVDAYSRKVIGYYLSDNLKTDGFLEALRMALATVSDAKGIIHHSDKGTQYTSIAYQDELLMNGMIISHTGVGKCYDNARMERVNNTIKVEQRCHRLSDNRKTAVSNINRVIAYYNVSRIHQALAYKTPEMVYTLGHTEFNHTGRACTKVAC